MLKWVYSLSDSQNTASKEVGVYTRDLLSIASCGFKLPAGIIFSTSGVWKCFADLGLANIWKEEIARLDVSKLEVQNLYNLSQTIQNKILKNDLPEDIATEIAKAYSNFEGLGETSINISFVPTNQIPEELFDKFELFHNVKGIERIFIAIKKLMASIFDAEFLYTLYKLRLSPFSLELPIICQKTFLTEVSGIIDTTQIPVGDSTAFTIDVIFGNILLVDKSEYNPDRYLVDMNSGEVLESIISTQEFMVVPNPKNTSGTPLKIPISDSWRKREKLSKESMSELFDIYQEIALNYPIDKFEIRWGYDAGVFWLIDYRLLETNQIPEENPTFIENVNIQSSIEEQLAIPEPEIIIEDSIDDAEIIYSAPVSHDKKIVVTEKDVEIDIDPINKIGYIANKPVEVVVPVNSNLLDKYQTSFEEEEEYALPKSIVIKKNKKENEQVLENDIIAVDDPRSKAYKALYAHPVKERAVSIDTLPVNLSHWSTLKSTSNTSEADFEEDLLDEVDVEIPFYIPLIQLMMVKRYILLENEKRLVAKELNKQKAQKDDAVNKLYQKPRTSYDEHIAQIKTINNIKNANAIGSSTAANNQSANIAPKSVSRSYNVYNISDMQLNVPKDTGNTIPNVIDDISSFDFFLSTENKPAPTVRPAPTRQQEEASQKLHTVIKKPVPMQKIAHTETTLAEDFGVREEPKRKSFLRKDDDSLTDTSTKIEETTQVKEVILDTHNLGDNFDLSKESPTYQTATKVYLNLYNVSEIDAKTAINADHFCFNSSIKKVDWESQISTIANLISPKSLLFKISKDILGNKELFENTLESLRVVRNIDGNKNVFIVFGNIKTGKDYENYKFQLTSFGFKRASNLKLFAEINSLIGLHNIEKITEIGLDGIVVNLKDLLSAISGGDINVDIFESGAWDLLLQAKGLNHQDIQIILDLGGLPISPKLLSAVLEASFTNIIVDKTNLIETKEILHKEEISRLVSHK